MSESRAAARPNSSRHTISLLIVTAAILWNVVGLSYAVSTSPAVSSDDAAVLLGIAFGQAGLGGAYLAWGRWNVALRAAVLLAAVGASSMLSALMLDEPQGRWLLMHLATSFVIATPLIVLRLAGFRIVHPGDVKHSATGRQQFSIWTLLSLTTAVAVLTAAFRGTEGLPVWNLHMAIFFAMHGVIGTICVWAVLRLHTWWTGLAVAAIACVLLGIGNPFHMATLTGVQAALMTVCGMIVRLGGYRLVGPERTRVATEAMEAMPRS